MQSGKLRHLITIKQPDSTVDLAGQSNPTYSTFKANVWSSRRQVGGVTDEERGRSASQLRLEYKVRFLQGLSNTMIIEDKINGNDVTVNIESVNGDITDERFQIITGTVENNG